jgi:hypothetical protein
VINASRIKDVLRWIAVLPGGLICAVLATFPIHWFVMMIHASRNTEMAHSLSDVPPDILERFGYAFFTPFILIFVGAKIAPHFKFYTGIALAILWGVLFGIALPLAQSRGLLNDYGWIRFTLTCLLGLAGAALGLYQAHRIDDELFFKRVSQT